MGLLPIVEKGKPVACHADWPLFYMNDFSRLGLVVSRLADALSALRSDGYIVHADERGTVLEIDGKDQVAAIVAALRARAIDCDTADLVSCVYQG
ncbi:MAG: hypothetical protein LBD10_12070 [Desulfobulbus sp.]|jgi:hypothetical protein|uniref:hypothetical protein n=1 Tax=Desulfobulbus sp. TaxID=895 RepID=UPI00284643D6|nr:hypothetical protein [Desulfobulbus sp.]MDR2550924.1 hypothetical protein [Desulfobulbus sp.]